MEGDLERRIEALETSHRETTTVLERLLQLSIASDAKLAGMDARLAGMDVKLAGMDVKLAGMDKKLAVIDAKLDAKASIADVAKYEPLAKAVADLVIDIRTLRDNARSDYRALFGAIITVALGLAALMAKSFHWL